MRNDSFYWFEWYDSYWMEDYYQTIYSIDIYEANHFFGFADKHFEQF